MEKALPYRWDCPDSKFEDFLAVHGNIVKGAFGGGMCAMEGLHAVPAILRLRSNAGVGQGCSIKGASGKGMHDMRWPDYMLAAQILQTPTWITSLLQP